MAKVIDLEGKRLQRASAWLEAHADERRRQHKLAMKHVRNLLRDIIGPDGDRFDDVDDPALRRDFLGRQEAAKHALVLVEEILRYFIAAVPDTDDTALRHLREMRKLAVLNTPRARRRNALLAVELLGYAHDQPETAQLLADHFARLDDGLQGLDVGELGERLRRYAHASSGKRGAIGRETLLAETMAVEQRDAFGIEVDMKNDVKTEVERIRKILAKDRAEVRRQ